MARDIFNRIVELGRPLSADAVRMLVAGLVEEDMLAQKLNIQYQQGITRIYEIASNRIFLFAGRTQGQMQVDKVVGGKGVSVGFIRRYGDVCQVAGNHITLVVDAGCQAYGDLARLQLVKASGVVVNSVAYQMAAQEAVINENLAAMFVRLEAA